VRIKGKTRATGTKKNLTTLQMEMLLLLRDSTKIIGLEELNQNTASSLFYWGFIEYRGERQGVNITESGLDLLNLQFDVERCYRTNKELPVAPSVMHYLGRTSLRLIKKGMVA
jgi:hypothetical protein